MNALTSRPADRIAGTIQVPGDKSISHRALIIAAMAVGETAITGLLEGEDVMATAAALDALGVASRRDDDGTWRVSGVGVGGLAEPDRVLDLGNSGTAIGRASSSGWPVMAIACPPPALFATRTSAPNACSISSV